MVTVHESSALWTRLLYVCYFWSLTPLCLDDIHALLEAGRKHEIDALSKAMKLQLLSQDHIQKHTLSVYALSCAFRLHDVARIAARASLALPDHLEYVKELDLITVRTYNNLVLDFRARCVNAIRPTMLWHGNHPLIRNPPVDARPGRPSRAGCVLGNPAWATMHIGGMPVHVAWRDGLEKLGHRYEHFPLPISAFSHELLTGS